MSNKITIGMLENMVKHLNKSTGNPVTSYTQSPDNKMTANIGNYHLDGAYGGYALYQIVNEGGGCRDIFEVGHISKKELYYLIRAFNVGRATK